MEWVRAGAEPALAIEAARAYQFFGLPSALSCDLGDATSGVLSPIDGQKTEGLPDMATPPKIVNVKRCDGRSFQKSCQYPFKPLTMLNTNVTRARIEISPASVRKIGRTASVLFCCRFFQATRHMGIHNSSISRPGRNSFILNSVGISERVLRMIYLRTTGEVGQ